jgi:hypothetical protein
MDLAAIAMNQIFTMSQISMVVDSFAELKPEPFAKVRPEP